MVKNKLHIIGCSFSTHRFFHLEPGDYPNDPSNYARIVAKQLDLEPVSYAREGQGNGFMLSTLEQNKNNFAPEDTVLVQMTNPDRLPNKMEFFDDVKIMELLNPIPRLVDCSGCSADELKTFGYVYEKVFHDRDHSHKLYCDTIISFCLTQPCNFIILPFVNREEYIERFINFDKIKFARNPWEYMPHVGDSDNHRFDHLTDELHNRVAHDILRDLDTQ